MTYQEILKSLPELSQEQLKTIASRATYLLGTPSFDDVDGIHEFLNAFSMSIQKRRISASGMQLNKAEIKKLVLESKEALDIQIKKMGQTNLTKTELTAIYRMLLMYCVHDLRKQNDRADENYNRIPIVPKTIMARAKHIQDIMDGLFPGYSNNIGASSVLLERMAGKRHG